MQMNISYKSSLQKKYNKKEKSIQFKKNPSIKLVVDDLAIKKVRQMTANSLSKKQLFLRIQQIKQSKQNQYKSLHPQQKPSIYYSKQIQQKRRTIYSNFQNQHNIKLHQPKQYNEQKKHKEYQEKTQNLNDDQLVRRYRSSNKNIKNQQMHQIIDQFQQSRNKFATQRKNIKSVGAGFRKRSIKSIQLTQKVQKQQNLQFKITKSKMKAFKTPQKPIKIGYSRKKLQQQITEQLKVSPFIQQKLLKRLSTKKEVKRQKIALISVQKILKKTYFWKQKVNLDQLIKKITQKRQQSIQKQNIFQSQDFQQNGFGICQALQKYDILSIKDLNAKIFNLIISCNQIVECPVFTHKGYDWKQVKINRFNQHLNKVQVQIVDSNDYQFRQPNDPIKPNNPKQKILLNRLSLKFSQKQKQQLLKKAPSLISQYKLSVQQIQILKQYINCQYWSRIKQAKSLQHNIKMYKKYQRYLNKLKCQNTLQQFFGRQINIQGLQKIVYDYVPSKQLGFQRRTTWRNMVHNMVYKQCHQIYTKHFSVIYDMAQNPIKFTQDLRIDLFSPLKIRQTHRNLPQICFYQHYYEIKSVIQTNHFAIIPNFIQCIIKLINKIHQFWLQKLNINKIIQVKPNGIDLSYFLLTLDKTLTVYIKRLKQYRQVIITQILHLLRDSFNIVSVNKNKNWLDQVRRQKQYNQRKYFKLLNQFFVTKINKQVYDYIIQQIIRWTQNCMLKMFKLNVTINQKFQFAFQPSKQTFQKHFSNTILKFQKQIQLIDNLLPDLIFAKNQKLKIYKKQHQLIKTHLKILCNIQYGIIFQQIKYSINNLLKYFKQLNFEVNQFTHKSLLIYQQQMNEIKNDQKRCRIFFITIPTIFVIDLNEMKTQILSVIIKRKQKILKRIQKQLSQQIQQQYNKFSQIFIRLSYRATKQQQYVEMQQFVKKQCLFFITKAELHYEVCCQYFNFFQKTFYEYTFALYIKHTKILLLHTKFNQQVNKKNIQLQQIFLQLLQKINQQRQEISRILDTMKFKIIQISLFFEVKQYQRYYVAVNQVFYQLQTAKHILKDVNRRENILQQTQSIFEQIKQIHKDLQPYYQLYSNFYQLKQFDHDCKEKPLMTLNCKLIRQKLQDYEKIFIKIAKALVDRRNSEALAICQIGKHIIIENKHNQWIIEALTKQAMTKKPQILKQALNQIFQGKQYNLKQITLQTILKQNLTSQKREFVQQKSLLAQRLYNLQKQLQRVVSKVKLLKLEFLYEQKLQNLQYIQKFYLLNILSQIQQQEQIVQVIQSNQIAHMIYKRISLISSKLHLLQQTIETLILFQFLLIRLLKMFRIKQVKDQFSKDQISILKDAEKVHIKLINHFKKQQTVVWDAIDSDSHKNKMEHTIKLLKQILLKIEIIVQDKIKHFPKLYFVPKLTLIQLLQQDTQTQMSQQILNDIFGNGFQQILFVQPDSKCKIKGIRGQFNQVYKFKNQINSKSVFWVKYSLINDQLQKITNKVYSQQFNSNKNYFIQEIIQIYVEWSLQIQQYQKNQELRQKLLQKWLNIKVDFNINTKKSQVQKNYIKLLVHMYLRDVTKRFLQLGNKIIPLYKYIQFNRNSKLCLAFPSNPQGISLQFGNQLPDYQCYPQFQFVQSQSLRSQFFNYLTVRQMQRESCVISKEFTHIFKKIVNHTVNHFVIVHIQDGQSIFTNLQYYIKGFLFSKSFGFLNVSIHTEMANLIKFFAYSLDKIYHSLQQNIYSLDIFDSSIKLQKNYNVNFVITAQSYSLNSLNIIQNHLFNSRTRQISLILPDINQIWKYRFASLKQANIISSNQLSQLKSLCHDLQKLYERHNFSRFKLHQIVKEVQQKIIQWQILKENNNNQLQNTNKNQLQNTKNNFKCIKQLIVKKIHMNFSKEQIILSSEQLKLSQLIKLYDQTFSVQNFIQNPIQTLKCMLIQIQIETILNLKRKQIINQIQDITATKQTNQNDKIQIKNRLQISEQTFEQLKDKFIKQKLTNQHKFTQPINKKIIIVSGKSITSFKTTLILKTLKQLQKMKLSVNSFIKYFIKQIFIHQKQQSFEKNHSDLNNIVCNIRNDNILPLIQCQSQNQQQTMCNKWHFIEDRFIQDKLQALSTSYKRIIQTSQVYKFRNISPNIVSICIFVKLPSSYSSLSQITLYQILKIKNVDLQRQSIRQLNILIKNIPNISQQLFISSISNLIKILNIFYQQNQISLVQNDIKETVFMILSWSFFQLTNIGHLNGLTFGTTFNYQIKHVYNYFYSYKKHCWLEWITMSEIITMPEVAVMPGLATMPQAIANQSHNFIHIPVNQSISSIYFLKILQGKCNITLQSDQNGCGQTSILKLALNKENMIQMFINGIFSFKKTVLQFEKSICKLNSDRKLSANNGKQYMFMIQDLNLNFLQQRSNQAQLFKKYLKGLCCYNFDILRKLQIQRCTFIISTTSSQQAQKHSSQKRHSSQQVLFKKSLIKQFIKIPFHYYTQQSIQTIYKTHLQQFFGNTQNPYSKEIRQMTKLLIHGIIDLKNNIIQYRQFMFKNFFRIFIGFMISTPKVVKDAQHILALWLFQIKRQFFDTSLFNQNNTMIHLFIKAFNNMQNNIIQLLKSQSNQLQVADLNVQKKKAIQNILRKSIIQSQKVNLQSQNVIFLKLALPNNPTPYKQQYRSYSQGLLPIQQIINQYLNSIKQRQFNGVIQYLCCQQVDYIIKVTRCFGFKNTHMFIKAQQNQQIRSVFNNITKLNITGNKFYILNLKQTNRFRKNLLFILKNHYLNISKNQHNKNQSKNQSIYKDKPNKDQQIPKNKPKDQQISKNKPLNEQISKNKAKNESTSKDKPNDQSTFKDKNKQKIEISSKIVILIQIPQFLTNQNLQDLNLISEYLQTGQFQSWVNLSKNQSNRKLNFMKQIRFLSTQSITYNKFVTFCKQSIHFIITCKYQNFYILNKKQSKLQYCTEKINLTKFISKFPSLYSKTQIKLLMQPYSALSMKQISKVFLYNSQIPYNLTRQYKILFPQKQSYSKKLYKRFNQLIYHYQKQYQQLLVNAINDREQAIRKIQEIYQFKEHLIKKLDRLQAKEMVLIEQVQIKQKQKQVLTNIQIDKKQIYHQQLQRCNKQQIICKQIALQVGQEMSKVGPILAKAQSVLQKVTRDDINQLRSFPNPPLPAAKVCQSLIFVFDQSHLIKQKVLESGEKIKDYWQYSKKFILNDKLLKKISDFSSPQTIKDVRKQVIQTVKQIIKKPEFIEQRVFKASNAAGNLSLWIKAVVDTYQVMIIIQPKKKQLRQAEQLMNNLKQVQTQKLTQFQQATKHVLNKQKQIEQTNNKIQTIKIQIDQVCDKIANVQKLLVWLGKTKQVWKWQIQFMQTKNKLQINYYCIWIVFSITYLACLTDDQTVKFNRHLIKQKSQVNQQFIQFLKQNMGEQGLSNITQSLQIKSLILLPSFKFYKQFNHEFTFNHIPYCLNQQFYNKIQSLFEHIKFYSNQVDGYWIVDQTQSINKLLKTKLNQINWNGITIDQVFDCSLNQNYESFFQTIKTNIHIITNQEDQQDDKQNQVQQDQSISHKNKYVIVTNFQHNFSLFYQYLQDFIRYFKQKHLIPIFITQFTQQCIDKVFEERFFNIKFCLSERNFTDLIRGGMNFLKLNKSKANNLMITLNNIKLRSQRLIHKIIGKHSQDNVVQNSNPKLSIQKLLQHNSQVVMMISQFEKMENDKQVLKDIQIKKQRQKHHFYKDNFTLSIQKLYLKSSQKSIKWQVYMTFSQLLNKQLIQNFMINIIFRQLGHQWNQKSSLEQKQHLQNYFQTQNDQDKYVHRFIQYIQHKLAHHQITQTNKIIQNLKQVLNCLIVTKKQKTNIINDIKNVYSNQCVILQPLVIGKQISIQTADIMINYNQGTKLIILAESLYHAKKMFSQIQSQLKQVIYKKLVQQKEMDLKQITRYFTQYQMFKVFILIQNQQYLNSFTNQIKNYTKIWNFQNYQLISTQNQITYLQRTLSQFMQKDQQRQLIKNKMRIFFHFI